MLAVRSTISGIPTLSSDPPSSPSSSTTVSRLLLSSSCSYSDLQQLHLGFRPIRSRPRRSGVLVLCCQLNVSGSSADGSSNDRDDFVQASLLLSETVGHYRGLKYGFVEEMSSSWQAGYHRRGPSKMPLKQPQMSVGAIGQGILRHFQNPTVFLKISCDGDFLLPIAVEGHVIERLADASWESKNEDYPNQFQFVKNLVLRLGHEVDMVRITKRVSDTYLSKVCLSKPGEACSISIDIHPSDAINIAKRCMTPIYISKQIFTTDAFQIAYGMIRTHPIKSVYDVTLDSPADVPDMLVKELDLVKCMKLAVSEERYDDAAIIRDQLMELRKT